MVAISYIDGARFCRAVIAAAQRVLAVQERLNLINVFPVPDGDTGTNMALTLRSIAQAALSADHQPLETVGERLAENALMSARGNSGAVLAQFFQGMAQAFKGKQRLNTKSFADAMNEAVLSAGKAFANPLEGTILSVMKAWSAELKLQSQKINDFSKLWQASLKAAQSALQKTPEQLSALAKAGVVDAGGKGFLAMLQGVNHYLESGDLNTTVLHTSSDSPDQQALTELEIDWDHPFCTECLIDGSDLDIGHIRAQLNSKGNSLIVAGNASKVRVHIHTADYEDVFKLARTWGTVSFEKAEDMRDQNQERLAHDTSELAVITDSSCDLPAEYFIKHKIRVVPLNLQMGNKSYLDRITITSDEIYDMMVQEGVRCQTSQPSPGAFQQAFGLASEQHQQGLALLLTDALSGTFQAGKLAAEHETRIDIETWDSRTIAAGLGLLVEIAVEAIEQGCDKAEVLRRLNIARPHTKILVSLATMKYLMRSGRVGRLRGWFATLLNLVPLIGLNELGGVRVQDKARPGQKSRDRLFQSVQTQTQGMTDIRIRVIHAGAKAEAEALAERFANHFQMPHVDVLPASPILGSHFGPGTVAASWQAFPPGVKTW